MAQQQYFVAALKCHGRSSTFQHCDHTFGVAARSKPVTIVFTVKAFTFGPPRFRAFPIGHLRMEAGCASRSVGWSTTGSFNFARLCAKEAPAQLKGGNVLLRSPSHASQRSWRSEPARCVGGHAASSDRRMRRASQHTSTRHLSNSEQPSRSGAFLGV